LFFVFVEQQADNSALRVAFRLRDSLRVDVQRDRDVRVPHELLHNLQVLAVAFEERCVGVPECMPTKVAYNSDFFCRWLQVRLVKRTWPVRQFPATVWAGKDPVLISRVGTLQPPVP
jgi:hypothetical protein